MDFFRYLLEPTEWGTSNGPATADTGHRSEGQTNGEIEVSEFG
jgi:hypothetical protein